MHQPIEPEPMRIRSVAVLTLAASAALAVSACGSLKQGIGLTKVVPDEFVTVSTAPLTEVNEVFDRMRKGQIEGRVVLDLAA